MPTPRKGLQMYFALGLLAYPIFLIGSFIISAIYGVLKFLITQLGASWEFATFCEKNKLFPFQFRKLHKAVLKEIIEDMKKAEEKQNKEPKE